MSRPPFTPAEYQRRLARVLALMDREGVDTLIVTDPCNIVWISGYDAWSFYVPQALIVSPRLREPLWIGRALDAPAVGHTAWISEASVVGYTDELVQIKGRHAADFIADVIRERGAGGSIMGYESDSYYLTPRYRDGLAAALPDARWKDIGPDLTRLRCVKSAEELAVMREAAAIASRAMTVALDHMRVGARECDVAGEIARAQISGTAEYGGFITSSPPYLLRGRRGGVPHLSWGQERFQNDETAYIELLGCRYRYQVTVARSLHFGNPPAKVVTAARASQDTILAGLDAARPGVTCGEVAERMLGVLRAAGIEKQTRSGYGVGIAYPPTSGERTMSLHPADTTVLQAGMTLHMHPNLIFEGWGLYITETIVITDGGAEPFTTLPRDLVIRA
jgi:ectoine hydrolase